MHITISCHNCGFVVFGRAVTRVDASTCDLQCSRCHAIVRVTATLLHAGEHHDDAGYWYTYDVDNNKIPIRNEKVIGKT